MYACIQVIRPHFLFTVCVCVCLVNDKLPEGNGDLHLWLRQTQRISRRLYDGSIQEDVCRQPLLIATVTKYIESYPKLVSVTREQLQTHTSTRAHAHRYSQLFIKTTAENVPFPFSEYGNGEHPLVFFRSIHCFGSVRKCLEVTLHALNSNTKALLCLNEIHSSLFIT